MRIRFYLDPETGFPHINRHGVTEPEVREVLMRPGEDRPGQDGARVATGQANSGRYLRVVYVPDAETAAFVITAYELEGKPLLAYRRRRRKKT